MERFNTEISQKTVQAISEYHRRIIAPELTWLKLPWYKKLWYNLTEWVKALVEKLKKRIRKTPEPDA